MDKAARVRGRFTSESGREAGAKSRGGGRPPNAHRRELEQIRLRALRKLLELGEGGISSDNATQVKALEVVIRGCTPKPTTPESKAGSEKVEPSETDAGGDEQP